MKKISTAYILLGLLGIFGAHRFYLEKIGTGLLYLLTGGLLGLGVLYDMFTLGRQVAEINHFDEPGPKKASTAYILLLFLGLGFLGAHRFYLGKIGTGLLWLFTGGLLGIGYVYDLFTLEDQVRTVNTRG